MDDLKPPMETITELDVVMVDMAHSSYDESSYEERRKQYDEMDKAFDKALKRLMEVDW